MKNVTARVHISCRHNRRHVTSSVTVICFTTSGDSVGKISGMAQHRGTVRLVPFVNMLNDIQDNQVVGLRHKINYKHT